MNSMTILLGITYVIGYFLSIIILKRFRHILDIPDYNSYPKYDEYSSNAQAYTMWSIVWPLFWVLKIIVLLFEKLINLTKYILNGNSSSRK